MNVIAVVPSIGSFGYAIFKNNELIKYGEQAMECREEKNKFKLNEFLSRIRYFIQDLHNAYRYDIIAVQCNDEKNGGDVDKAILGVMAKHSMFSAFTEHSKYMVTEKNWKRGLFEKSLPDVTIHNKIVNNGFVQKNKFIALPPTILNSTKQANILEEYKNQVSAIGLGKYVNDFFLVN